MAEGGGGKQRTGQENHRNAKSSGEASAWAAPKTLRYLVDIYGGICQHLSTPPFSSNPFLNVGNYLRKGPDAMNFVTANFRKWQHLQWSFWLWKIPISRCSTFRMSRSLLCTLPTMEISRRKIRPEKVLSRFRVKHHIEWTVNPEHLSRIAIPSWSFMF